MHAGPEQALEVGLESVAEEALDGLGIPVAGGVHDDDDDDGAREK